MNRNKSRLLYRIQRTSLKKTESYYLFMPRRKRGDQQQ
jgi:hypothetical protein